MIDRVMTAVTILMLMLSLPGGGVRADSAQDYWPAWRGPMASGVSPTGPAAPDLERDAEHQVEGRGSG